MGLTINNCIERYFIYRIELFLNHIHMSCLYADEMKRGIGMYDAFLSIVKPFISSYFVCK